MNRIGKNRKLTDSFKNAINGLWYCIKKERNMRIHTCAAFYVLLFAPFLDLKRDENALVIVLIGLVVIAEMFNTAIEKVCDFATKEYSQRIKHIKDTAAGAVFVTSLVAVGVGFVLLYKPVEILNLLNNIISNPFYLIMLILSVIWSIIYIFVGPVEIMKLFKRKG